MKRNVTNADYEGIVDGIRRLAKSDPNFKDYDFDGAGLMSIIRLLALQGNQQAFSDNMLFNEGFLKTAEMRENAGSVASFLSYVPNSKRCSEAYADIVVTPYAGSVPPNEVTLNVNDSFLGVKDGHTFNFVPAETTTTHLENGVYTFKNVKLLQGVWASNTYNVEGLAIDTYIIPNTDIDIETLSVGVLDDVTTQTVETFNRYNSAYDLGITNPLFFLQLNRSGLYEIEFGDGVLSKKLADGNVAVVNYLVTKGASGDGITSLIPASSIGGYPSVSVNVLAASANGSEAESVSSIKHAAPLSVGRNGSAVTNDDYVVKTKVLYPAASVTSWGGEYNNPPRQGYTFVAVKNADGSNLSTSAKSNLVEYLRKYNVGSITPIIVDAEDYLVNVTSEVFWNPALTNIRSPAMRTLIIDKLRTWSGSSLELFGSQFDAGDVSDLINDTDVSIRTNVTSVSYEKRYVIEDIATQNPRQLNFHKDLKAKSVRITGFTMAAQDPEIVADYSYFAHDASGDGNLYIYENKSGITRQYSDVPIGTVNYSTGLLYLNPTQFATVEEFIAVKAEASTINQNLDSVRGQIIKLNELDITMTVG